MLRKSPDTGIFLHGVPFPSEMKLVCGGGLIGTLGRAPLLGNPKDEVLERYAKCPVNGPSSLHGPCWGTRRGFVCWDF